MFEIQRPAVIESTVEAAFVALHDTLVTANAEWDGGDVARTWLEHAGDDVLHHLTMAMHGMKSPLASMSEVERVLSREAYIGVLQLLTVTSALIDEEAALREPLEPVREAARKMLDELSPFIGRASRRVATAWRAS